MASPDDPNVADNAAPTLVVDKSSALIALIDRSPVISLAWTGRFEPERHSPSHERLQTPNF